MPGPSPSVALVPALATHLLLATLALACDGDSDGAPSSDIGVDAAGDAGDVAHDVAANDGRGSGEWEGCDYRVVAGGDVQASAQGALVEAQSGEVVCLGPGNFPFLVELSIVADGITLRGAGAERTTLDFSGQDTGANGISILGDGNVVEDFTIMDTPGDGIRAADVNGITMRRLRAGWSTPASGENGAYALYPVGSTRVLVEDCEVFGSRDAGIYVGQSRDIIVRNNEVWGNVAGIELENSTDGLVEGNHAHDNVGGILVFNLPNLPVQGGQRVIVRDNLVENNNLASFADPSTTVAKVPPGTGIVILAADDNEFHRNEVRGHDTFGFLILTYDPSLFGPNSDESFNLYSTGNHIHDNVFADNGANPRGLAGALLASFAPLPDIVWDGCEDPALDREATENRNCLTDNGDAGYLDFDGCNEMTETSTDIAAVTCTQAPIEEPEF